MARTRSGKGASAKGQGDEKSNAATSSSSSSSVYTLSETSNPPKLFILPKTASPAARIITLQHPRCNRPARFLVCPKAGFFEFTAITPPKSAPRSWLLSPVSPADTNASGDAKQPAQITQSPALYLATPYDPLFLLLPALFASDAQSSSSSETKSKKRMFLSLDDHLDAVPVPSDPSSDSPNESSNHLAALLTTSPTLRRLAESRLRAVCDVVRAGDEDMFRVNEAKLLGELLGKARRMIGADGEDEQQGEKKRRLPASMEERFVRRALEAPVLGVKIARGGTSTTTMEEGSGSGAATPLSGGGDSQASDSSVETVMSAESVATSVSAVTAATSVAPEDENVISAITASDEVVSLQRLRVAFDFILSSCVPPSVAELLRAELTKGTASEAVDFTPLDDYLTRLTKLRQEAAAARSADFSRKREADEEADERAEKKRKKEAEEKAKKQNMSRGVKNLMKVDTKGMKKMSDFFKPKGA
ncbi:hypothetical protein VTJ49DRAFT_4492 [Mycothermus thermophilus]|uniref:Ribonuclease H2 subunit B n=1 Tax=Humicola insolens TaxID=85995 RepID=A0ABR3V5D5_HUMIN